MNYFIGFTGLAIMRQFAVGARRALSLQCRGGDGEMQSTPTGFAKQSEGLAPALKEFFTRLTRFAGFTGLSIMRRFAAGARRALPLQCRGGDGEMQSTPTGFAKQPEGLDFHNRRSSTCGSALSNNCLQGRTNSRFSPALQAEKGRRPAVMKIKPFGLNPAVGRFFTRLTGFAGLTGLSLSLTLGLNPVLSSIMRRLAVETGRAPSPQRHCSDRTRGDAARPVSTKHTTVEQRRLLDNRISKYKFYY
jgi:hypothetical protein